MKIEINELKKIKLEKLEKIRALGINPYPHNFEKTSNFLNLFEKYDYKLKEHEQTEDYYKIAGRITLFRDMGNLTFATLIDEDSKIQIVFMKKNISELKQKLLKLLDLGDIVGVYGNIFKTKKGELSILVKDFDILCKSLGSLGDKFHGVNDIELNYRNRSLDMITNSKSKEILKKRFLITQKVREFMIKKEFLEVETPITQTSYGGAAAKPFVTYHNDLETDLYLRVSPEQSLKRVMVGGMEAVFEINKNFRNESIDRTHNPEFTMLEAYKSYVDYNYCMELCEELVEYICLELFGTTKLKYQDTEIDFKRPWKKISVKKALKISKNWDVDKMSDEELFLEVEKINETLPEKTRGYAILSLFEKYGEPLGIQPTHFIDYPKESTPLCKIHRDDNSLIERFESFVCGMEISNAYTELNDGNLQRTLFENQAKQKENGNEDSWGDGLDTDFLNAMDLGMPPAGGIGIGIDRLCMLLLNQNSIRDIIYFPTMKKIENKETGKSKNTKIAVVLLNENVKEEWKKLNTVSHLNASFASREGKKLLLQDKIKSKDNKEIVLNIQHAIIIKRIKSNKEIINILKQAKEENLEISEFTQEMIETTNDKLVIEKTLTKNKNELDYLGILVFGDKKKVEKITKQFDLY
jgi:lysyl-tRNA synthetase class 2